MKIIVPTFRLFVAAAGVCLLAGSLTPVLAQGPSTGGPAPGTPAATTDVPVDGGASLLLAAGAAYALKRLRKNKPVAVSR
ncbi:PID-CTERM protein-sorting domain-containing protein [Hymenobacter convexus]|uniref:PID-CTERM protein-sorting domain-containing protein n=1 Tax=Hymenobacter sp. CA1UV-4 TaxID=3063782 RepID=UPI0027138266|nr:hypothetical protein [Hymenobacter sp. CA1UV-4]MDO7851008.1 hypothetical protein [Hymenobacter sp. CA1UV-4]